MTATTITESTTTVLDLPGLSVQQVQHEIALAEAAGAENIHEGRLWLGELRAELAKRKA